MMSKVVFLIAAFCLLACGGKESKELFTVRIAVDDSAMTYSDRTVIDLGDGYESTIPELGDSLARIQAAMSDSEQHSGKSYTARLVVDVRSDVGCDLLVKAARTALRNEFNETRLRWVLQDQTTLEVPVVAMQGYGIYHLISVDRGGLTLQTYQHIIYDAPPDSVAVAGHPVVSFSRLSDPVLLPRVNNQLDIPVLQAELALLTAELGKVGYVKGRHFVIAPVGDFPASEFFEVAKSIIESIPKSPVVQSAGFWNGARYIPPSPPPGEFRYANGLVMSFKDFSISMKVQYVMSYNSRANGLKDLLGLLEEHKAVTDSGMFEHPAWKGLLCAGGQLYRAIEGNNQTRLKLLLDYGVGVNSYPFEELEAQPETYSDHGYTVERDANREYREDYHGYTLLLFAVSTNRAGIVRYLIQRGADVKRKSKKYSYKSPYSYFSEGPITAGRVVSPLGLATENIRIFKKNVLDGSYHGVWLDEYEKRSEEIIAVLKEAGAKQ